MSQLASRIDYMVSTTKGMIRTIQSQGTGDLMFTATLYKHGRKLNSIELAEAGSFSRLIRQYVKSEQPDKVRVELKTMSDNVQKWMKQFDLQESGETLSRPLPVSTYNTGHSGYAGLGEAEINDLVNKRFVELERQKELERVNQELNELRERNGELERELEELTTTVEAKKQVEYYSSIIGAALPGLAKFFEASAIGPALTFLAGSEDDKENGLDEPLLEAPMVSAPVDMLCNFIRTLNEQEIATLYLLMAEVEKDRSNIQRVLSYITRHQPGQDSL
ncbi:MAG: hypothetical protein ACK5CH_09520 [Bacteroidota bacterium]